ncbi:peptidylprolyl isomerase [Siculibacillus lacustris]|nr:peptidylprolyl isomerase [Siculibacillus lacustris]
MLDVLRRGASTWVSKVLLSVLIVSFGVWGIADVFRGFGSNTAFRVGSHEIGVAELDQTYARELQQASSRLGRNLTKDEALRTGVSQQILSKIVTDVTLSEAVRSLHLGISDSTIGAQILMDPAFKGASGAFDRSRFVELLRSNGWNEDIYVTRRRADALRSQLLDGVSGGFTAPKVWAEAIDRYRNETRTLRYVTVSPASLGALPTPSESDLATFYEQRKAAFRAPETRGLIALVLDAAAIANPADVTDDDARAEYARQKAKFTTPEKRRVLQLSFDDAAAATAAAARLAAGTPFEDLVAERGAKVEDVDLGLLARTGFVDTTIGDAAFAIPEVGGTVGPVAGRIATVILKLAEKVPGTEKAYADVANELKTEIARRRAEGEVLSRHDQIEDALAGGAKLSEVATRFGLNPVVIDAVTRDGTLSSGVKLTGLPQQAKLLTGAFESDVGVENDTLDLGGHGFLWYAVTAVAPAHDRPLAEVHDRVVAAWTAEADAKRLDAAAAAFVARLKAGEEFDKVAADTKLEPKTSSEIKRDEPADDLSTAAVSAAFAGGEGHVAIAPAKDEGRIVLQVASITEPVFFAETDDAKALAAQTSNAIQNTLLESWLVRVQKEIGVSSNQQVIARVIGRSKD